MRCRATAPCWPEPLRASHRRRRGPRSPRRPAPGVGRLRSQFLGLIGLVVQDDAALPGIEPGSAAAPGDVLLVLLVIVVALDPPADPGPQDVDLDAVGDLEGHDVLVVVDVDDMAEDPPTRHDFVAHLDAADE